MQEQHVDDYLDAYALGALEATEVALVDEHLERCTRCQRLAGEARAAAHELLFATPLVEPPPQLRTRLMARFRQEVAAGVPASLTTNGAIAQSGAARADSGATGPASWFDRLLHSLGGGGEERRDPVASRLFDLLSDPRVAIWQVAGTPDAPRASARLVGIPDGDEAILVTSGLSALPPERAYQVWFLKDGQPRPNSLFTVDRHGTGRQLVRAPRHLRDWDVIAVTPEPASGSPAPTGAIVLMGQLSA